MGCAGMYICMYVGTAIGRDPKEQEYVVGICRA